MSISDYWEVMKLDVGVGVVGVETSDWPEDHWHVWLTSEDHRCWSSPHISTVVLTVTEARELAAWLTAAAAVVENNTDQGGDQ